MLKRFARFNQSIPITFWIHSKQEIADKLVQFSEEKTSEGLVH